MGSDTSEKVTVSAPNSKEQSTGQQSSNSSSTGTTTGTTPTTVGHEASTKVASTTVVSSSASESANNSNEHKSCIEKAWREGVDYFKVENSIVCHDGESIQGSHVTSNEGIYVLQWKYYDKLAHTHLSPLDSLTNAAHTHTHKAKVMYYYETLNSIDYKGSMTSLQSCQSGFSSISRHSTSGVSSTMSSSHSEKFPKYLLDNSDGKGKQLL